MNLIWEIYEDDDFLDSPNKYDDYLTIFNDDNEDIFTKDYLLPTEKASGSEIDGKPVYTFRAVQSKGFSSYFYGDLLTLANNPFKCYFYYWPFFKNP